MFHPVVAGLIDLGFVPPDFISYGSWSHIELYASLIWGLDHAARAELKTNRIPFIVTSLGRNVDPFMLHIYATLAEQERTLFSQRANAALAAAKLRV